MKSCKTCQHLDVKPDARGRIVVRQGSVFRCNAPDPEPPNWPACISKAHTFRWPPSRCYMQGSEGANCPTWTRRPTTHRNSSGDPGAA